MSQFRSSWPIPTARSARAVAHLGVILSILVSACAEIQQMMKDSAAVSTKTDARLNERFNVQDGYMPMRDFEEFKSEIAKEGPKQKRKFCMSANGAVTGKNLDEARRKWPATFDRPADYLFWIDNRYEFFAIHFNDRKPFEETLKRSKRICVWSDGNRETVGDEHDRANLYEVAKWDGITADDVAAAKAEVERERQTPPAASASGSTAPSTSDGG